MNRSLCIHGHFYQPPRFDPWLGHVPPEGSAAPQHDWNTRISKECYTPLAFARVLNAQGQIQDLVNCYAWISFNFGPTLLQWLENSAPQTYARILEADQKSLLRLGHGNALAQVYHHPIMPLATDLDRELEIGWAVEDFTRRFSRVPEGMWLAETAADTPTLEALAAAGIRFTILAPRQAAQVRTQGQTEFTPVTEDILDTSRPYLVQLPSGASLSVFFYDGGISQAVAFERLLENGEQFWQRLQERLKNGLRCVATDGESYGHHFPFGEMALAYVIKQARQGRDGLQLTNFATLLEASPPTDEVRIHEQSSWSCVHGVERWKSHCGCGEGGHPGWRQDWRRPLRRALNYVRYYVDEHYFRQGKSLFHDPLDALRAYGAVLSGTLSREKFLHKVCLPDTGTAERIQAARLFVMQRLSLASFASCAWFFDDVARIEPLNALACAKRCLELLVATGGPNVQDGLLDILEEAQSNMRTEWDGAFLWRTQIQTRSPVLQELGAYAVLAGENTYAWPGLILHLEDTELKGLWLETGEEEQRPFATGRYPEEAHHLAELSLLRSQMAEDRLFEEMCEAAEDLLLLLGPYTEGQSKPLPRLDFLAPGIIWTCVIKGAPLAEDLRLFLRQWLQKNPGTQKLLLDRIEKYGTQLSKNLPENTLDLVRVLTAVTDFGMQIFWWDVQNHVFAAPFQKEFAPLYTLLGIARPST